MFLDNTLMPYVWQASTLRVVFLTLVESKDNFRKSGFKPGRFRYDSAGLHESGLKEVLRFRLSLAVKYLGVTIDAMLSWKE